MADIPFTMLGACPVPGETPAGEDARYEPEYAAVLEEIEKLSFSGQGSAISWLAVEKNAIVLLSEKTKDMQIAAYLGVALWQNRGLEGMLDGIRVLGGLLETFWETAWPTIKRMRGRVNAIDWWHERTYAFLQDAATHNNSLSAELQQETLEALAKLDELVASLMPEASSLRDLSAAFRRLVVAPTEQATDEPPAAEASRPQTTGEPPAVEASRPQSPAPPTSERAQPAPPAPDTEDPLVLRRHFVAAGRAYLTSARRVEPGNASLWQLSRLLTWGSIAALPASEDGQTLLPSPDMSALAQTRQKLQAGNALEAAFEAEDFFAAAPFCLDAQQTVHAALCGLGSPFADAANCVRQESANFLARLPGVEKLSFTDGTPFAAPQTLVWLREAAARQTQQEKKPDALRGDPCESAFTAARSLLEQNRLVEALAVLEDAKTASPAINLRLSTCQLLLLRENGKIDAAQALAEALLQDITARDLDNWDPALALETLAAARDAFIVNESRYERELRDLRRRIARLRPVSALD